MMIVALIIFYYWGLGTVDYARRRFLDLFLGLRRVPALRIPDSEGFAYYDDTRPSGPTIKFAPTVYLQRYSTVVQVLRIKALTSPITKVVDFGCSDMSFFHFLKDVKEIEEIICVDIDEVTLERFRCRVIPTTTDYLTKRETPLLVKIMKGSVSDLDVRLKDTNAVVAIELIEHLFPDTLELLPYSIFGIIQPEIAIFTTPNADFNVLFPNFTGFRNDDHKFEWSRQQFEDWALNLTVRYPDYEVGFNGIGRGPEGTDQYGCCSQIAVFCRKANARVKFDKASELKEVHKIILTVDYPVHVETRTKEEIILCDAESFLRTHFSDENYSVNDRIEVPLKDIMRYVPKSCTSLQMLREILLEAGWKVEKVAEDYAVILPYYGFESDNSTSDMSDKDNANYEVNWDGDVEEENWDILSENLQDESTNYCGSQLVQDECLPSLSVSKELESKPDDGFNDGKPSGALHNGHKHEDSPPSLDSCSQTFVETRVSVNLGAQDSITFCTSEKNDSGRPIIRRRSFERPNKNKNFRYSLCCDEPKSSSACDIVGAKNLAVAFIGVERKEGSSEEIARLEDSCSQSKAGDSGYPNSSERDMDMDLTPEQVDEIVTESESSFEDGSNDEEESVQGEEGERPHRPQQVQQLQWLDNMENGDVANNNRDWEGNNMEAAEAHIGEPLQFEDVIDHRDEFALPLMDAAQHDFESDEDNKYISACEFLNTSDDTVVASEESFRHDDTLFYDHIDDEEEDGAVGGIPSNCFVPFGFDLPCSGSAPEGRLINNERGEEDFPDWLLNILVDGDVDVDVVEVIVDDGAGDIMVEVEEDEQDEADVNNEEPEMRVDGDLMGGGEPSSQN